MLIALMSDIHANRQAFEAALAAAGNEGAELIVILGDIVGYGADPEWCVDRCRELIEQGAIAVRGNHDQAAAQKTSSMTATAALVMDWTRNRLDADARRFLGELPLVVEDEDRLYVHADISKPESWNYIRDDESARHHLDNCPRQISFCGHTHRPALYSPSPTGRINQFIPSSMYEIPLASHRKWLAVMGAVGQPRDGNPAAAFGLYDSDRLTLRFMRVAYDIDMTVARIMQEGLPESLAARLRKGR